MPRVKESDLNTFLGLKNPGYLPVEGTHICAYQPGASAVIEAVSLAEQVRHAHEPQAEFLVEFTAQAILEGLALGDEASRELPVFWKGVDCRRPLGEEDSSVFVY
jgi:hypothetical protein